MRRVRGAIVVVVRAGEGMYSKSDVTIKFCRSRTKGGKDEKRKRGEREARYLTWRALLEVP